MRARYYTPGEPVPGWDRGGADPDADLRAAGADAHYFAIADGSGRSVGILTVAPALGLRAGRLAGGRHLWRRRRPGSTIREIDFEMLSHRYVVGLRANGRRARDADCTDPIANATLYEIPGAPAREGDDMIPILFRVVLLAAEGQVVCSRWEGNARTGWRSPLLHAPTGAGCRRSTRRSRRSRSSRPRRSTGCSPSCPSPRV